MSKNKIFAIAAIAIVLIAAISAVCILTQNQTNTTTEKTVTDALGRTVNIPEKIDAIYSIGACSLRLVSYFDAADKVQALETAGTFNTRDDQTYYLINKATFSVLPQVAPTAEAILALNPSVIITSTAEDVATADTLQSQTNIPVYVINANLEFGQAFYDQITSIGTLLGEKTRATELNKGISTMINDITSKATTGTKTAYACGMFYYGGASFLKGSGNYLPFDYSGVTNAIAPADNGQPYVITLETLINANPDYIFIDSIGLADGKNSIKDSINSNTGIDQVSAVKNGNIYSTMVYKCYGTNWENQLVNAYYVADVMNGEAHSWTFEDKANEVLQLFYPDTTMTYAQITQDQTGNGCNGVTL
jgi:iron complex transport system substrate-binding protein